MRQLFAIAMLGALAGCAEAGGAGPVVLPPDAKQGIETQAQGSGPVPAPASTGVSDLIGELKSKLAANAVADLQGAIAIAQGANDKAALQCYTWELGVVQTLNSTVNASPAFGLKTPITDFEKLRAARLALNSGSGLLSEFNLNCAALVNDEIGTLARVGIKVGGIVGTGGLGAPALGILGVINQSLPLPLPGP